MKGADKRFSWLLEATLDPYDVEIAATVTDVVFSSGGQKSHDVVLAQKVIMAFIFVNFIDAKIAMERVLDLKAAGVTAKLRER